MCPRLLSRAGFLPGAESGQRRFGNVGMETLAKGFGTRMRGGTERKAAGDAGPSGAGPGDLGACWRGDLSLWGYRPVPSHAKPRHPGGARIARTRSQRAKLAHFGIRLSGNWEHHPTSLPTPLALDPRASTQSCPQSASFPPASFFPLGSWTLGWDRVGPRAGAGYYKIRESNARVARKE